MLPSIAKSGWLDATFMQHGPWGMAWLRPEQLFGLTGLDGLTHALFWSLLANIGVRGGVAVARAFGPRGQPGAAVRRCAERDATSSPVFWRGRANTRPAARCASVFWAAPTAQAFLTLCAARGRGAWPTRSGRRATGAVCRDQLAGAIGSASARALVASVAEEETLSPDDVLRILDEASQMRAYSRALEGKSRSLEQATAELRAANEQLKSLDRLKDDFMSSVTHELRTPLTPSARWPN
jgi:signal transduction histidine kinase